MTRPSDGQCNPSRIIEPSNTASDGNSAIRMVSLSRSSAHMPRVILRTVEPAKLLACQSVEKRCTRMKASRDTSDMIRSVNGTIACSPTRRSVIETSPSATMAPKAVNAVRRAAGSDAPKVTASTRCPENSGMNRSAAVAPSKPPATVAAPTGRLSQWRNTNGITTRIAAGRLLTEAVMASSGCAGALAGSVGWRATAWPNASVVENGSDYWEAIEDRDVRPDRCWRKRPSKGHAGIRYWLRTRGRDLRIHRNHANPPRFERQCAAYKCIRGILQYAGAEVLREVLGLRFIAPAAAAVS